MKEFNVKLLVCTTEDVRIKANSMEEAVSLAETLVKTKYNTNNTVLLSRNESEQWNNIMNNCGDDFLKFMDANLYGMAESHIDCWNVRYKNKTAKEIRWDLEVNHDISLEVENAEDNLNRELSNEEYKYLCAMFNTEVIKQLFGCADFYV